MCTTACTYVWPPSWLQRNSKWNNANLELLEFRVVSTSVKQFTLWFIYRHQLLIKTLSFVTIIISPYFNTLHIQSLQKFTLVHTVVFRVMTRCSLVGVYQRLGGTICLQIQVFYKQQSIYKKRGFPGDKTSDCSLVCHDTVQTGRWHQHAGEIYCQHVAPEIFKNLEKEVIYSQGNW